MEAEIELKERACPECQAVIVWHPDYVAWCESCGWNIRPLEPDPPKNLLEKFYAKLGEQQSQKLFEHISKRSSLKPTISPDRVLAFIIALITHALTLGLFLTGVRLLVFGYSDFARLVTVFIGIVFVGLAWVLRPRFNELPKKFVVTKEEAPTLYAVANRVADAFKAKHVDYIMLSPNFNASFGRIGWQQKRMLELGLPLFASLTDEERVALMGHELAHDVNGDSTRSIIVYSALSSLMGWYVMIRPPRIWVPEGGFWSILMLPINLIVLTIAGFGWVGAFILVHLLWRDSQRAEYYADYLGAEVGGTGSMLNVLQKLHLTNTFATVLQWVALNKDFREENLFSLLRERMETVPPSEIERVRRVQQMQNSRLDVTHPPTAFRLDVLKAHPITEPKVSISPNEAVEIQKELAKIEPAVQKKLVDLRKDGYFVYSAA